MARAALDKLLESTGVEDVAGSDGAGRTPALHSIEVVAGELAGEQRLQIGEVISSILPAA
jgi:hypothetical protein